MYHFGIVAGALAAVTGFEGPSMDQSSKRTPVGLAHALRRFHPEPLQDMPALAGAFICAAPGCAWATLRDLQAGRYMPGLLGLLLTALLVHRAGHAWVRPQGITRLDWATAISIAVWVFFFLIANQADGFYLCIPVVLLVALYPPAPLAGPAVGAVAALASLSTFATAGIELATTAGVLLACSAALGNLSARMPARTDSSAPQAPALWGSAATLHWDADGNATSYSESFKTLLGYSTDKDHTPYDFFDLVHPDDRSGLERLFRAELRLARTGEPLNRKAAQVRLLARDGTWRWVLGDIVALFVEGSQVRHCICTFVDITSHVMAHDALAAARRNLQSQSVELQGLRERLRNAEQSRRELHRLLPLAWGAPARAADEALDRLQDSPALEPGAIKAAAEARRHLAEASRQMDWVVVLSLLEQGEWHPARISFDIMALATEVAAAVGPVAQARGVAIQTAGQLDTPLALGHRLYCRDAMEAIVRDAATSAPAGSILLMSAKARSGRVGVELRMAGAMPAARRAAYFDRPPDAAGLAPVSPYAARLIVRAQGGDIVLGASSRQGTSIQIMFEHASDDPAGHAEAEALDILVAGTVDFSQLAVAACAGLPANVRHAADGTAAVDGVILQRPDVILADTTHGLGGFREGFETIRAMQRDAAEPASLWVAMGRPEHVPAEVFDQCFAGRAAWRELAGFLRQALATKRAGAPAVQVDPALLLAMPSYVESRKRMAAELRDALEAGRRVEAARIAHLLGGSPGLRGFDAAVAACRAIGDLDSSVPFDRLLLLMDEVDAVLRRLEA